MDVTTKLARCSPEYLALLGTFPLRPIRDDAEHRRAIEVVNSLIDRAGSAPTRRITSTFSVSLSPTTKTRFTSIPNSRPRIGFAISWMSTA